MAVSISLLDLNTEHQRHIDQIISYIQSNKFEVICFQEVFEKDFEHYERELAMHGFFLPLANVNASNQWGTPPEGNWGICILSKLPILSHESTYYKGEEGTIPELIDGEPNSMNRGLLWCTIEKEASFFTIATTHFTVSSHGETTDEQLAVFAQLQKVLTTIPEVILCGDFNAPRGQEIFGTLSQMYRDNVPAHIESTLDPELHRAKGVKLVVDGLFTSAQYVASGVKMVCGLSDHCALRAEISRK